MGKLTSDFQYNKEFDTCSMLPKHTH